VQLSLWDVLGGEQRVESSDIGGILSQICNVCTLMLNPMAISNTDGSALGLSNVAVVDSDGGTLKFSSFAFGNRDS